MGNLKLEGVYWTLVNYTGGYTGWGYVRFATPPLHNIGTGPTVVNLGTADPEDYAKQSITP